MTTLRQMTRPEVALKKYKIDGKKKTKLLQGWQKELRNTSEGRYEETPERRGQDASAEIMRSFSKDYERL